jgi:hypothetical protein
MVIAAVAVFTQRFTLSFRTRDRKIMAMGISIITATTSIIAGVMSAGVDPERTFRRDSGMCSVRTSAKSMFNITTTQSIEIRAFSTFTSVISCLVAIFARLLWSCPFLCYRTQH